MIDLVVARAFRLHGGKEVSGPAERRPDASTTMGPGHEVGRGVLGGAASAAYEWSGGGDAADARPGNSDPERGEVGDMRRRAFLRALAGELGILPSYVDVTGRTRRTSDATRQAVLAAMGIDASTEEAARRELAGMAEEAAARILDPVRVVRGIDSRTVRARVPGSGATWDLELREEGGRVHTASGRVGPRAAGRAVSLRLPALLPFGYHVARLRLRTPDGATRSAEQRLIVTPGRCETARERLGPSGAFGLLVNLYTVRSARNWGVGDLTDLRDLVAYAGDVGASFVGINPLHALHNRGAEISPYSPVSRLYRNPLYIDVEAVPELAAARRLGVRLSSASFRADLAELRAAPRIDYERVMDRKRPVLEALHRVFARRHRGRDTARGRAYRAYLAREGEPLLDFATFLVLRRHLMRGRAGGYWRRWPARYRDPRSAAVLDFRARHVEEIDLHCWLQFEIDRQLTRAASNRARSPAADRDLSGPGHRLLRRGQRRVGIPGALSARGERRRPARRLLPRRTELGPAAGRPAAPRRRRLRVLGAPGASWPGARGRAAHRSRHGALPSVLDSRRVLGTGRRLRALPVRRSARYPSSGERAGRSIGDR